MQFAKFEIQIGGEMTNTVVRDGISPAEYLIMQALHGDHSLTPIAITSERNVQVTEEMDRLRQRFNTKNSSAALNAVFPGARPVNVPVNFADVGLVDIPHAEDAVAEDLEESGMSPEDARAVIAATNKRVADEEAAAKAAKEAEAKAIAEAEASKNEDQGDEGSKEDEKSEEEKPKKKKSKKKVAPKKAEKEETQFEEEVKIEYND